MPKITALIHVADNEATALEGTLKALRHCDEVLVINHNSEQAIRTSAERYRATLKQAILGVDSGAYALEARNPWILCLQPGESLSQELEASLEKWKQVEPAATVGYLVGIREQTEKGWCARPRELRLINRTLLNWKDAMPGNVPNAPELKGDLLCFRDSTKNATE